MEYPLLINGEERGKLKLEKQGLYTLMEAGAPGARGLVRLWVQGGGELAYLGVMEPREGGLYLCRKLSRLEMSAFPGTIERAVDRNMLGNLVYITNEKASDEVQAAKAKLQGEETCPEAGQPEPAPETGNRGREEPEYGKAEVETGEEQEIELLPETGDGREPQIPEPVGPQGPGMESGEEELLWTARRDGSLIARKGERYLVALPARLRSVPPGARLRRIGGREYLLFVY